MNYQNININQTHIRLTTDLNEHNLMEFIYKIRNELEYYIKFNNDFLISLDKLTKKENENNLPKIVQLMYNASRCCDVGPMAAVAGSIAELSIDYLIKNNSKNSIVENGGDIAVINDKKVLCGIYSNNNVLKNKIAFKLKPRKNPIGICTSSGKIGHSISFGKSDSVTVISNKASISDALATGIGNEVKGESSQSAISNALECCEKYRELFKGILIISGNNIGTIGKLPKIVETSEFYLDKI